VINTVLRTFDQYGTVSFVCPCITKLRLCKNIDREMDISRIFLNVKFHDEDIGRDMTF
jgi:hypothetical protein